MGVSNAKIEKKPSRYGDKEERVYGRAAVLALFKARPGSIIRAYIDEKAAREFGYLMKWCAQQKRAYHVVTTADLEKISKSTHHEGVMLLVRNKKPVSVHEMIASLATQARPVVLLDRVGNPHNIGAFVRTAAHFGVPYILVHGVPVSASPSMARVAMGGLEAVDLVAIDDLAFVVKRLKALGYFFYGTSSHLGFSAWDVEIPKKSVFVFGNEVRGISEEVNAVCDDQLSIPGTGAVESLNVSVAAGIVLGAYQRSMSF